MYLKLKYYDVWVSNKPLSKAIINNLILLFIFPFKTDVTLGFYL